MWSILIFAPYNFDNPILGELKVTSLNLIHLVLMAYWWQSLLGVKKLSFFTILSIRLGLGFFFCSDNIYHGAFSHPPPPPSPSFNLPLGFLAFDQFVWPLVHAFVAIGMMFIGV